MGKGFIGRIWTKISASRDYFSANHQEKARRHSNAGSNKGNEHEITICIHIIVARIRLGVLCRRQKNRPRRRQPAPVVCYGVLMIRKLLVVVASLGVALAALVAVAYVTNAAPAVPRIAAADVDSTRHYVIKLHAQWCPVCRIGKGAWSEIEQAYAGRVNLLVLDFTSETTTEASRAEARRLGCTDCAMSTTKEYMNSG